MRCFYQADHLVVDVVRMMQSGGFWGPAKIVQQYEAEGIAVTWLEASLALKVAEVAGQVIRRNDGRHYAKRGRV